MSVFILIPKKGNVKRVFKLLHKCTHFTCQQTNANTPSSQASAVQELPDEHARFRKGRGTREQIANICWIIEKLQNSRKTSTSASLTMLKPLNVQITTNCGKFLKRWKYHTTLKQQLEPSMEQQTGSKLRKDNIKPIYCYPAYLTYM